MGKHVKSFAPIVADDSKVLILGSMPGVTSLRLGEYYSLEHNAFWFIMGELFGAYPNLPYTQRCDILKENKIALWDVLKSCSRKGSLDSNIHTESQRPNSIGGLLKKHSTITHVFFNGTKAESFFKKEILPQLGHKQVEKLTLTRLPSTSPAHASLTKQQKLKQWLIVKDVL